MPDGARSHLTATRNERRNKDTALAVAMDSSSMFVRRPLFAGRLYDFVVAAQETVIHVVRVLVESRDRPPVIP